MVEEIVALIAGVIIVATSIWLIVRKAKERK